MKRFIDLRGQDTGYSFAWYDTVINVFEKFNDNQVWDNWNDFAYDYNMNNPAGHELSRYRSLIPIWVEIK